SLRSSASRFKVSIGVAKMPAGSVAAKPTRARPTSTPMREPYNVPLSFIVVMKCTSYRIVVSSSLCRFNFLTDARQGLIELRDVLSPALRQIRSSSAATAKHLRCSFDEIAGLQSKSLGALVDGNDHEGSV